MKGKGLRAVSLSSFDDILAVKAVDTKLGTQKLLVTCISDENAEDAE